ncbi:HAD-like domain-containing protein [Pavlovales sp. CCMP2436]|nr:HAD-like domain-containing protein [Pavlovales sp. CCMP2436]|mmetsp:Transcript_6504/g.16913  ORF Transcript_6504/g.16913 Transcript_6504/m.16913 type:complete len:457 (-) Transcript_6504:130-1500(-)
MTGGMRALLLASLPLAALCVTMGYRAARSRARLLSRSCALPASARVVVFDLDHSLARYNLPALYALVHECAASFLVREHSYDASLLRSYDHSWPSMKGLVFDCQTGDIVLLDELGVVARAIHGEHRVLDAGAIVARYGGPGCRWREADALCGGASRGDRYFAMSTGFDSGLSLLCARIVDLADARANAAGQTADYCIHDDVFAAMMSCFQQPAFAAETGGFFSALRAEPGKYLPPRPRVADWLIRVRARGLRVVIVTNSAADFARFTIAAAFGELAEQACCDIIVANAKKPGWFAKPSPLRSVEWAHHVGTGIASSADGEVVEAPGLPCTHMLAGGSAEALEKLFGCSGHEIVFVGDSCHGEVVPARKFGWQTMAVVEELEGGFLEPAFWGGSFWSAPPAGAEPSPGTSAAARPQSWLGSAFKAHAHAIVADVDSLATGAGICWRQQEPQADATPS